MNQIAVTPQPVSELTPQSDPSTGLPSAPECSVPRVEPEYVEVGPARNRLYLLSPEQSHRLIEILNDHAIETYAIGKPTELTGFPLEDLGLYIDYKALEGEIGVEIYVEGNDGPDLRRYDLGHLTVTLNAPGHQTVSLDEELELDHISEFSFEDLLPERSYEIQANFKTARAIRG